MYPVHPEESGQLQGCGESVAAALSKVGVAQLTCVCVCLCGCVVASEWGRGQCGVHGSVERSSGPGKRDCGAHR